jgi:hypothetical protein
MSLNWNLNDIPGHDTLCWETYTGTPEEMAALVERMFFTGPNWEWTADKTAVSRMSTTTHTILLLSMQVGLGRITEVNWREWYTRLSMIEKLYGPMRATSDGPVFLTPDEVRAHIGLRVNVADETKAKFNARMARFLREQASRALRG